MNYLTEVKLGAILKKIFPTSNVQAQYRWEIAHNLFRKIDYVVELSKKDALNLRGIETFNLSELPPEEEEETLDKSLPTFLLIEFDGHHHYGNTNVVRDLKGKLGLCCWNEIEPTIFGLRIPYWIQIDLRLALKWFGITADYSDKFPQGFISKKIKLPSYFGVSGEDRFIEEMKNLPSDISSEVYKSLCVKADEQGAPQVASLRLWEKLICTFDPERATVLDEFLDASLDPDKFYKRFSKKLYERHERDYLTASVYQKKFMEPKLKEEVNQSLRRYLDFNKFIGGMKRT